MVEVHFSYRAEVGRQPQSIVEAHFAETPLVGDRVVVGGVTGTVEAREWIAPRQGGGAGLVTSYELLAVLAPV